MTLKDQLNEHLRYRKELQVIQPLQNDDVFKINHTILLLFQELKKDCEASKFLVDDWFENHEVENHTLIEQHKRNVGIYKQAIRNFQNSLDDVLENIE